MGPGPGGRTRRATALAAAAVALIGGWAPTGAEAAVAHTVLEGETLSGIAAANGISTESLAAYNGLAADAWAISGTTISVPAAAETGTAATTTGGHTVVEGETLSGIAAANGVSTESLASANGLAADAWVITGSTLQIPSAETSTTEPAAASTSWTTEIYSPNGAASLSSNAAANWEALRQASISRYGVDIYPAGSLSAYRTYEQQAYLYDLYLSGQGAPANPPGTSSHEYGTAVDVAAPEMRSVVDEIGPAYGWTKVHGPAEWWHVDYVGP